MTVLKSLVDTNPAKHHNPRDIILNYLTKNMTEGKNIISKAM